MVIGNGMVAKAFSLYRNRGDIVVFASGVSNSSETDCKKFNRERDLLTSTVRDHQDKCFIYFSTCSIEDKDVCETPYVRHKVTIESLISRHHSNYLIFRLPQLIGESSNKSTLVNFLFNKIHQGHSFNLWGNAVRYLIDVADVVKIVSYVVDRRIFTNKTVNVALMSYKVLDIVRLLEKILGKRASYNYMEKGAFFKIDCTEIAPIVQKLRIPSDKNYLERVLMKYYSRRPKPSSD